MWPVTPESEGPPGLGTPHAFDPLAAAQKLQNSFYPLVIYRSHGTWPIDR